MERVEIRGVANVLKSASFGTSGVHTRRDRYSRVFNVRRYLLQFYPVCWLGTVTRESRQRPIYSFLFTLVPRSLFAESSHGSRSRALTIYVIRSRLRAQDTQTVYEK